jgi:DNA-binding transcriptional LysR family regulator
MQRIFSLPLAAVAPRHPSTSARRVHQAKNPLQYAKHGIPHDLSFSSANVCSGGIVVRVVLSVSNLHWNRDFSSLLMATLQRITIAWLPSFMAGSVK